MAIQALVFAAATVLLAQNGVKQLTTEEIEKALEKKDVFFLDVRDAKEVSELGTIEGYVNIPVGELESRLKEVPKDKLILTA